MAEQREQDRAAEILEQQQRAKIRNSLKRKDGIHFCAVRSPTFDELQLQYHKRVNEKVLSLLEESQQKNLGDTIPASSPLSPLKLRQNSKATDSFHL